MSAAPFKPGNVVQVRCALFTGNQTTINLSNNSLLNVFGNVDVATGNPGIVRLATTGTPAGLRIKGSIVDNSGGGAKLFATTGLTSCVQDQAFPAGCGTASSTSVVAPPASNDPACFAVLPATLTRFGASRVAGRPLVSLSWATAGKLHNYYFAIERSADSKEFRPWARWWAPAAASCPAAMPTPTTTRWMAPRTTACARSILMARLLTRPS